MLIEPATGEKRTLNTIELSADLVIVGGGMAGACCAVTAARQGIKVVLVQDRPVLGGNASSEVRLWVLGATSHMNNNNRWAREGGVLDELLVENMWRNPEGNALLFDTVLLEKVTAEPNITLLLNTAAVDVEKSDADTIASVRAFCSQNSTMYHLHAPRFCDASGDGVLGFISGAAFRMGAESTDEFGEKFAPDASYGNLLGHSIYFYSKDVGKPVKFIPPSYALEDIKKVPRWRHFNAQNFGCKLWWIEWGGRLDTVHETEQIKWELWRVVYGVWNHIKNSGEFPEAENLTLEWVGTIPGKRESRRFEGDYMLTQQDVIEQRDHEDGVAFGGWSVDLHPADGVYADRPGCDQWHAKGAYQIPYRCMYSRNIRNLFLAGRVISSSHVAFGTTRVMATCAHSAQAVGVAAAVCKERSLQPADLAKQPELKQFQQRLLATGQHVPRMRLQPDDNPANRAKLTTSSRLVLRELPAGDDADQLKKGRAQLLPLPAGKAPQMTVRLDVSEATTLRAELRTCSRRESYTPDVTLAAVDLPLKAGDDQAVTLSFDDVELKEPAYVFYTLMKNEAVSVRLSEKRVTGVVTVSYMRTQTPATDIGVDTFEMWTPDRRPQGKNFAFTLSDALDVFTQANLCDGVFRPAGTPHAWVAAFDDDRPTLTLSWDAPQTLDGLDLFFDADYDHAAESVLRDHPERAMPYCVSHYRVLDEAGRVLFEDTEHHLSLARVRFEAPVTSKSLTLELLETHGPSPAALFGVRCV